MALKLIFLKFKLVHAEHIDIVISRCLLLGQHSLVVLFLDELMASISLLLLCLQVLLCAIYSAIQSLHLRVLVTDGNVSTISMLGRHDVFDVVQEELIGQLRPRLSCHVHHEHILIVVAPFLYSLVFWLGSHSRALTWSINSLNGTNQLILILLIHLLCIISPILFNYDFLLEVNLFWFILVSH